MSDNTKDTEIEPKLRETMQGIARLLDKAIAEATGEQKTYGFLFSRSRPRGALTTSATPIGATSSRCSRK